MRYPQHEHEKGEAMNTKKKAEQQPMTLDQMGPRELASLFAMVGLLAGRIPNGEAVSAERLVDSADLIADEWVKRRTG